jgi:putative ABC transport system permease protein
VILTLALAIGANTAIFDVVYAVLMRPLPYADANRIVSVTRVGGGAGSIHLYTFLAENNPGFEDFAAYDEGGGGINLTTGDQPTMVETTRVSLNYFRLLQALCVAIAGSAIGIGAALWLTRLLNGELLA